MNNTAENSSTEVHSSSSNLLFGISETAYAVDNDLGDLLDPYTFERQTGQDMNALSIQNNSTQCTAKNFGEKNSSQCIVAVEPVCHMKLDSLAKLKHSTKQLLCLVEEIKTKTVPKSFMRNNFNQFCLSDLITPGSTSNVISSPVDITCAKAIEKLEAQTKALETVFDAEEDNCSVYKRLTRKCHCLNRPEYNDFMIHFNETTKYFTSTLGEIIKNIRIVKKFLFMGGNYTKNVLTFLNEGLSGSTHAEKVDIIQGCAHADVCCVFDDSSIVVICITGSDSDFTTDATLQAQAASFLHMLVQLEEGRRYLSFSSKITNDIKKVLRKKTTKLEHDTLELLHSTLNILQPPLSQYANVTYYSKRVDEGCSSKALTALVQYRKCMTLEEVFDYLDLLHKLSQDDSGKSEIVTLIPTLLNLFSCMLKEYDNSIKAF